MKLLDIINESSRREPTDEEKKKARIIFKALKTGKFPFPSGGGMYKYILPDEHYTLVDDDGSLCVVLTMHPEQKMVTYLTYNDEKTGEMEEKIVDKKIRPSLYHWMEEQISKKFGQFRIRIIF